MIIENNNISGLLSELGPLDEITTDLGFVRWQWDYNRATYDYKLQDNQNEYFLRVNARAVEGRLESSSAVLKIEEAYIGRVTFPHGLEYGTDVPDSILKQCKQKLDELHKKLA